MLTTEPSRRIGAGAICEHPWFVNRCALTLTLTLTLALTPSPSLTPSLPPSLTPSLTLTLTLTRFVNRCAAPLPPPPLTLQPERLGAVMEVVVDEAPLAKIEP